jgi:hypothetical protein
MLWGRPETQTVIGLSMRRAFLGLALLALLLDPLALVARVAAAGGHACSDHLCLCSSRCPPRRTAARDHCQGASKSAAAMRAACRHDKTTALPSATVAVLATAASAPRMADRESLDPRPERRAPSAFVRLESPPPRSL